MSMTEVTSLRERSHASLPIWSSRSGETFDVLAVPMRGLGEDASYRSTTVIDHPRGTPS